MALDRAERKSERLRDVVVRPVLEEGHPDHRGPWVAHPLELVDDEALGPLGVVGDRGCRRRLEGHGLQVAVVAVPLRAQVGDPVPGDSHEPGLDAAAPAEGVPAVPRRDEDLLGDVFRVGGSPSERRAIVCTRLDQSR